MSFHVVGILCFLVGFCALASGVPEPFGSGFCFPSYSQSRIRWNFLFLSCVLGGLFILSIFPIDEVNTSPCFEHCQALVFNQHYIICWVVLLASPKSFHAFLRMTCHIVGPRNILISNFLEPIGSFSVRSYGDLRFKHVCVIFHNIFARFTLSLSRNPNKRGQGNDVGSPEATSFKNIVHIQSMFSFFPASFYIVHVHRQG